MVIPVLKGIDLIGSTDDLNESKIRGTAYIAEENDIGTDCFHFQVISLEYLTKLISENDVFDGRATFIVEKFDETLLEIEIKKILQDCIRPTWDEAAKAVNRHLKWEYDNIKYMTSKEVLTKLDEEN
ncbi:Imm8 family immunity protein [Paenibacillus sp. sgz5001063]|uniref:Imm8 family immunity protein n=1 Tax=Paenibacillus sp. sgz5001063 TaxID=3242474 RepID=UPI0036D3F531